MCNGGGQGVEKELSAETAGGKLESSQVRLMSCLVSQCGESYPL